MRVIRPPLSGDRLRNIILLYNTKQDPRRAHVLIVSGRNKVADLSMSVPRCFREIGLAPESCGSSWSAQAEQQVDHGGKQGNASSLMQGRQWNRDEVKEGRNS